MFSLLIPATGPLTQVVKRSLTITNQNSQPVAFRVMTTAPKLYCVRPNLGRVEPGESVDVSVMLQPLEEEPPLNSKCKDKFLVQSTLITPEKEAMAMRDLWLAPDMKEEGVVHRQKLRVLYLLAEEDPLEEKDEPKDVSDFKNKRHALLSRPVETTYRRHLGIPDLAPPFPLFPIVVPAPTPEPEPECGAIAPPTPTLVPLVGECTFPGHFDIESQIPLVFTANHEPPTAPTTFPSSKAETIYVENPLNEELLVKYGAARSEIENLRTNIEITSVVSTPESRSKRNRTISDAGGAPAGMDEDNVISVKNLPAKERLAKPTEAQAEIDKLRTQVNPVAQIRDPDRNTRATTLGDTRLPEIDRFEECFASLLRHLSQGNTVLKRSSLIDLTHTEAQHMMDFLSKALDNLTIESNRITKRVLVLHSRLAKLRQVFPTYCELKGVDCDLTKPQFEGGFGYVCRGTYNNLPVCVKVVRQYQQQDNNKYIRAQAKEFALWAQLSHRNIVPFYGIYLTEGNVPRLCIVSPWMQNGDLKRYLTNFSNVPRLPLLLDAIVGLDYLHKSSIIHADLKATNVLVSDIGRAMISDFGVSHIALTCPVSTTATTGTPNWSAPEFFIEEGARPTKESDIWSFGCLCYETLTGKIPFHRCKLPAQLYRALMVHEIPLSGEDPGQIDHAVVEFLKRCWSYDPKQRPSTDAIIRFFRGLHIQDNRPLPVDDDPVLPSIPRASADIEIDYKCISEVLGRISQTPEGEYNGADEEEHEGEEEGDVAKESKSGLKGRISVIFGGFVSGLSRLW